MNSSDYTFLLNQPGAVNDRQTEALEKIVTEFPYFQSARALRLKGLYSQNSFQYNFALKVAAAYTTDRGVLFDFITSDTFTTINKGLYDQKVAELHGIEVKESHVVIEQNDEPAIDKVEQSILSSIKESGAEEIELVETFPTNDEETIAEITAETVETPAIEGPNDNEITEQTLTEIPAIDALQEIDLSASELKTQFVPVQEVAPEFSDEPVVEIESEQIPTEDSNEQTEDQIATETSIDSSVSEQAKQTPEQKLHIGEPLEFSKTETHSFQEWLQLSRLKPINREEDLIETEPKTEPETAAPTGNGPQPEGPIVLGDLKPEAATDPTGNGPEPPDRPIAVGKLGPELEKIKKNELIDRFIERNPKIPQMKPDVKPAVIEEPKEDHSALMTETLARVYLEQKKYPKAIQAYEILILKYPEKSSFFADRISEIKNLQQNNTV